MTKSYVRFERDPTPPGRKTEVWAVISRSQGYQLGTILWRSEWRQYVFEPFLYTVWSAGCMLEVSAFIKERMDARRVIAAAPR